MQFETLAIEGPLLIRPRKHGDARGYFAETFRADRFAEAAGDHVFVQENQSLSAAPGTIRGLHFQTDPFAQGKLVRCVAGAIFDVAVDIRAGSATFGQWVCAELTAQDCNQLWVPAGFAHGFCTLTADAVVSYKVTNWYSPDHDKGVAWDDPQIAVRWPDLADAATLSAKDRAQPLLADLPAMFAPAA
jgi:dTDP-4-dehydrorhamnose 3,5-epimerase